MTLAVTNPASATDYLRAGAAALLVLALTAVHHIWGAVIYATPWRVHIVYVAIPVAILFVVLLAAGWRNRGMPSGRAATWGAIGVILFFPVLLIGIYEGGYNHLVKNLLYFVFGEPVARMMCPDDGTCELPSDFVFEATGIAQVFAGLYAGYAAIRLAMAIRR